MTRIKIRKKSGYVVVRGYDESRWGKFNEALEHRVIVEEYIGTKLPAESVVHHIDRLRDNNSIQNLLLLPSQQIHMLLHSYMNSKKQRLVDAVTKWSRDNMDEQRMKNLGEPTVFQKNEEVSNSHAVETEARIKLDEIELKLPVDRLINQYLELKLAYPNHLALVQVGCFYTVYEDDALLLERKLQYKTFSCRFTGFIAAGTSIDNEKFLRQLQLERIPYIRVVQSDLPRTGRVLNRHIEEVFNLETAA